MMKSVVSSFVVRNLTLSQTLSSSLTQVKFYVKVIVKMIILFYKIKEGVCEESEK